MPTIKNGQILLYCCFNEIKGSGTSSAKNMLEIFLIQHTSI